LGAPLSLGYQILFPSIGTVADAPKVVSLTFEGISVCSTGTAATTTTTASTTTASSGSKQSLWF
jgi:hypothetical protein